MPRAGGQYVYLREAWTPLSGFLYGWTHSLSWVSTSAPTSRMWWFCLWNKCSTRLPTAWLEQCVPSAGERRTLVAHGKNGLDVFKAAQSQGINNSVFESNINTKTNAGFSLPVALRYADHETDFFARGHRGLLLHLSAAACGSGRDCRGVRHPDADFYGCGRTWANWMARPHAIRLGGS